MGNDALTAANNHTQKHEIPQTNYPHRFSVAPMMDWTTSVCRQFHRILSSKALLYTEMVTTGAVLRGNTERFLRYHSNEHPIALQLGGHQAKDLAACAILAERNGYDEVNLNAGCPSDRVQNGMIGAILMAHSQVVCDGIKAMQDAVSLPITIKHRLGIDDFDSYEFLRDFVGTVAHSGCKTFIVHARKAILAGLSPKQNREVPPLDYERVLKLKKDFPHLNIVINGGIKDHSTGLSLIKKGLDGVMVGREAYQNPLMLTSVDSLYYGTESPQDHLSLNNRLIDWVIEQTQLGIELKHIVRHMLGLYAGQPGSKQYRRYLSENMNKKESGPEVFQKAFSLITH